MIFEYGRLYQKGFILVTIQNTLCRKHSFPNYKAIQWLRQLVTGVLLRSYSFGHRPIHVVFMVDKVALVRVSPSVLRFLMSLSDHRCPMLILSSITDAV
jgi:hypothetical protein